MIITTTHQIEGKHIIEYKQLVFGEVIAGANVVRDFFAGIRDVIGGRAGAYESKLSDSRREALDEMPAQAKKLGANAVVGVEVNYQSLGAKGMFMVVASGTAVRVA
ncbi:YbjQ family protein [Spirabiliibacterium falconis]|uniref:YbjQ family protein n=1 Tax=Spirabiliibacterium falconis TaxID=572023 RepID=UPI001AAD48A0|nr:YbjQ family protein [Spirabiliibacterium falconis]MBE2894512.1 YbjQ family protein [Spirabiliibacterium falconis]